MCFRLPLPLTFCTEPIGGTKGVVALRADHPRVRRIYQPALFRNGLFVIEDRGAERLKGIEQPVQLYRVLGAGVPHRRSRGGAVGRVSVDLDPRRARLARRTGAVPSRPSRTIDGLRAGSPYDLVPELGRPARRELDPLVHDRRKCRGTGRNFGHLADRLVQKLDRITGTDGSRFGKASEELTPHLGAFHEGLPFLVEELLRYEDQLVEYLG